MPLPSLLARASLVASLFVALPTSLHAQPADVPPEPEPQVAPEAPQAEPQAPPPPSEPTPSEPTPPEPTPPTVVSDVPTPPAVAPATAPRTTVREWRVRSGSNTARGFVFADDRHVLTTARVVRHRGSVRLHDPASDVTHSAEIVAVDSTLGIALLRADAPLGAPAIVGTVRTGETIRVMRGANAVEGLVLVARTERVEVSDVCDAGAPVRNANGDVVAICVSSTTATLTSAASALATPERASAPPAWRPRVTIGLNYRMRQDFESSLGGELGLGLVAWDRFGFALRTGFQQNAESDATDTIEVGSRIEVAGELQVHHAFSLAGAPIRLVLGVGALYRAERTRVTENFAELQPDCDPTAMRCGIVYSRERDTTTDHRVLPHARVELNLGGLIFAYAAALDVDELADTTHTLTIGFALF